MPVRALWTCPECGARFVSRNLSHSCVRTSVAEFLSDKPPLAVKLFKRFVAEAREFGDVILHPVKTRIALMVAVRFAAANKFHRDYLDGHLWLKRNPRSAKFRKIDDLKGNFVCHFRATAPAFFDREFRALLGEAYRIGLGQRSERPRR